MSENRGVKEILAAVRQRSGEAGVYSGTIFQRLDAARKALSDAGFTGTSDPGASYAEMFEAVAVKFTELGRELLDMRSSYIPSKLAEDPEGLFGASSGGSLKKIAELINEDALMESYENTFFRLLGMPSTSDMEERRLNTVTNNGTLMSYEEDPGFSRTNKVLNKRAQPITDRLDFPSNTAYDFITSSTSALDLLAELGFQEKDKLSNILAFIGDLKRAEKYDENTARIATGLKNEITKEAKIDVSKRASDAQFLNSLTDFFGPKEEGSNEQASIDYTDFVLSKTLNIALEWLAPELVNSIKPSLKSRLWLEEVERKPSVTMTQLHSRENFWQYSYLLFPPIQDARVASCISEPRKMVAEPFLPESMRKVNGIVMKSTLLEAVIRIRLDLISGFPHNSAQLSPSQVVLASDGQNTPITPEQMGVVEAMLIERLFDALIGFAIDARKKIKTAVSVQQRTRRAPTSRAKGPDQAAQNYTPLGITPDQKKLEDLILMEDAIMLLFGDGSVPEAISAQEGVARNAGVKSAHLMGAALSALGVPRQWAQKQVKKKVEDDARSNEKQGDESTSGLRAVMGMSKGVGAVDMLAFLIALFSIDERYLINLLNNKQFEYMKKEYPSGFFDNFARETPSRSEAVDRVTELAYDSYQIFRFALSSPVGRARLGPLT